MIENFKLKDGRIVVIKHLSIEDYEKDNNYEFVHNWLYRVNKYLDAEFEKEELDKNKKFYYDFILSNTEENIVIGAFHEEKIIASASLMFNEKKQKSKHVGNWGIAIHPDYHNNGLGMRLLSLMEDVAREKGLKRLEAEYYDGNDNAEHLYLKKMEYTMEGKRKYAALLKNGKYVDKILIGKIIDDSLNL